MSIIKLPDEGNTHTAKVKSCESVKGQYGMQVKFEFADGDVLFMPYDSAVRQLMRSGFDGGQDENGDDVADFEAVTGETLTFARTHNKKPGAKPFWDVSVASGAEKAGAVPSKRLTGPDTRTAGQKIIDAAIPPDDAPPAFHREVPLPESEDGPSINEQIGLADPAFEGASAKEISYYALAERVAAFQAKLAKLYEMSFDAASINAMTFSIWKN